jgi:hypothetical protein
MRNEKGSGAGGDGTTKRSFVGFDVRITGLKKITMLSTTLLTLI